MSVDIWIPKSIQNNLFFEGALQVGISNGIVLLLYVNEWNTLEFNVVLEQMQTNQLKSMLFRITWMLAPAALVM